MGAGDPHGDDAERAAVQPLARARAGDVRELIRVVRHEHERGVVPATPVGPGELEVDRVGAGAEQIGQHLRPRVQLGIAVGVRLNDLRVGAQRGVVHEHVVVDPGEVDASLHSVGVGVQRAENVVAVEAEVEREVVARARRDADMGDVVQRGHCCHERLRPVAPGHADDLRAIRDSALGELSQVVPGLQDDRPDASPPGLVGELEALGLPAARLQVHDQHGRAGGAYGHDFGGGPAGSRLPRPAKRVARGDSKEREQHQRAEQHEHALPVRRQHRDQPCRGKDRRPGGGNALGAASGEGEPGGVAGDQRERHCQHRDADAVGQRVREQDRHRDRRKQRQHRGQAGTPGWPSGCRAFGSGGGSLGAQHVMTSGSSGAREQARRDSQARARR